MEAPLRRAERGQEVTPYESPGDEHAALIVPGRPFAKQRPRMTRGGFAYTPKGTRSFEDLVRQLGAQHWPEPYDCPVFVSAAFFFEPAKSLSQKKKAALMGTPHIGRPDLDNLVKAILDGLNRVAFTDDKLVAQVWACKRYSATQESRITVRPCP